MTKATFLTLENATFENCFGAKETKQRILTRNASTQSIVDDILYIDEEIESWLKPDALKLYRTLDSAQQAEISDMLLDFLKSI